MPKLPDVQLVLVGQLAQNLAGIRANLTDDISALVNGLGLGDRIVITGYVNDPELTWYYQNARLFAFPSLFEGFGMPPVEALGMGLPVLTTKCTAIPEVTLGLAHYVSDPYAVGEWADCLLKMFANPQHFLPSSNQIAKLRATYAPKTIAEQYMKLGVFNDK